MSKGEDIVCSVFERHGGKASQSTTSRSTSVTKIVNIKPLPFWERFCYDLNKNIYSYLGGMQ
jgi:hypothetical protein